MEHLAFHRELLADGGRVHAMVQAVRAAVRPGDVVVDLGTGSGLLAVAAAQSGARRVYAIEAAGEIMDVARQVVADNGVGDRVVLVEGCSTEVDLDDEADVLLAEIVGSFGLDEGIIGYVDDARKRFLRPGGRLVPDGLRLVAAPTEQGLSLTSWAARLETQMGIDLSALDLHTRHLSRGMHAIAEALLGPPVELLDCDLWCPPAAPFHGGGSARLERDGLLCGWVGWFELRSGGRPLLDTSPGCDLPSWRQVWLPAGPPLAVADGTEASLEVRYDPPFWSWQLQVGDTNRRFSEFEVLPAPSLAPPSLAPPSPVQES